MKKLFLFSLFFIYFFSFLSAKEVVVPNNYFYDEPQILTSEERGIIVAINNVLKEKIGSEIAVYIVKSLEGEDSFNFSVKVFDKLKIGKKGKDNGVLVFMALKEKKIEVRTGYGVEGILPDGKVGRILDKYFIPFAKKGDYGKGITYLVYELADEIAKANGFSLKNSSQRKVKHSKKSSGGIGIAGLFILWFILYIFPPTRPIAGWIFYIALMMMGSGGRNNSSNDSFGGGFGGFGGGSTGGGGASRGW